MSHSFNYGDKVEVNGHAGTIRSIWLDYNGNRITNVVFDDQSLIPPEMEIPEVHLKPLRRSYDYSGGYRGYYNKEFQCPRCGDKWKETIHPIFGKKVVWYDCLRCKIKKEDV